MSNLILSDKHTPCGYGEILGCSGYGEVKNIVCMTANGDNNFLNEGIVKGSILFIDKDEKFQEGFLNVFKYKKKLSPQYKLSRTKIAGAAFFGKVIMTVNQYR